MQLVDAIWSTAPAFREQYELPDGLFRKSVVNALVHRPYTQRGDIFLNVRPDELEVVNPGRLSLGVTPRNILHVTRRRNEGLARIFHDVKLMEREGSGFDLMLERLLSTGRGAPQTKEGVDSVHVTVPRRVVHPRVAVLLQKIEGKGLTQRERITLGLLAQTEGLTLLELAGRLDVDDAGPWLGRLGSMDLVEHSGRTRATRYFVPSELLQAAGLDDKTTLVRIEPHRLRALIVEDVVRYPNASISEMRRRVGQEIAQRTLKRAIDDLLAERRIRATGANRWRRYHPMGGEKDALEPNKVDTDETTR